MAQSNIPRLERPAFFDGQRLTAADLSAVQTYHRELRWLHNRSLHNWGIAFGYAVSGAKDERTVRVQPGYALDCQGRDLILGDPLDMAIPAISGDEQGNPVTYHLTASHAEDADLIAQTRDGVCNTSGAVRRPEQPLIRWQEPGDVRYGLDVILITIKVQNCRLLEDVSGSSRRDAIPPSQPYIASGETTGSQTFWTLWPNAASPVGIATQVVTASAGFRTVPQYQAHVIGVRVINLPESPFNGSVLEGYPQIANPTATGFELRVILPAGFITGGGRLNPDGVLRPDFMENFSTVMGWRVAWMGIEG
jgi:hypothetical protein